MMKNECYTYFSIKGNFDPGVISDILNLAPCKQWSIGDKRANGTEYDFALWEFGRCDDYNILVENQMIQTITPLLSKIDELRRIKSEYDVSLTLEIVPSVYAGETEPCLAPSSEIIKFCYETGTDIDIDLYVLKSE